MTGQPATASTAAPETAGPLAQMTGQPAPASTAIDESAGTHDPGVRGRNDSLLDSGAGVGPSPTAVQPPAVLDPWDPGGPDAPISVPPADVNAAVGFAQLRVLADTLEDVMRLRISIGNRVGAAAIETFAVTQHLDGISDTEKKLYLALRRHFRVVTPDIRQWVLDTPGLGEPLMARIVGALGDPVIATPYRWDTNPPDGHECLPACGAERHLIAEEPFRRTPRQLLAYCGWGDPARRRRVGMTAEDAAALGNRRLKPLIYVAAECCLRQTGGAPIVEPAADGPTAPPDLSSRPSERTTADVPPAGRTKRPGRRSPYRDAYDQARTRYEDRDDWTLGHKHQAAIRYAAKAIVIDLWRVRSGLPPRWQTAT